MVIKSKISKELLILLKKDLDQNLTLKNISEKFDLGYSTVRKYSHSIATVPNFIQEYVEEKKKRDTNEPQVLHNAIAGIVDAKNDITLEEIRGELALMNMDVSISTISRAMKKIGYSRKRISLIPVERNSTRNIEMRKTYANHISLFVNSQLYFLDECGFNKHIFRTYGYSQKNTKAIKDISGNKGANISLICIISSQGVVAYEIIQNSYNGLRLNDFLANKLPLCSQGRIRNTLVMDNAAPHHNSEVKRICQDKNFNVQYLPAYSPQLNPIENFFSIVKSNYKSCDLPKTNFEEIKLAIYSSIEKIDSNVFGSLYSEMRKWVDIARSGNKFI